MLVDASGCPVTLGPRLGRGGEGEVYAVAGDPMLAVKLLHGGRRDGKHAKVKAMVEAPPAGAYDDVAGSPVLTWPRTLLYDRAARRDEATFAGYAMARVAPDGFVAFHQVTSAARRQGLGGAPLSWDHLLVLGQRLSHLVRTLHRFGYAAGDLNDRNVLVSRRLTPLLMDTDSFQVPRGKRGFFPCLVADALYWPPELLDVDLRSHPVDRTASDNYALGVLLFQLFLGGLRPYQSRGSLVDGLDSLAAKTRAGHYPWANPKRGVLEPPAGAPDYQALPKSLRKAFERCFVDGHRKPNKRPTADEWHDLLADLRSKGSRAPVPQVVAVPKPNVVLRAKPAAVAKPVVRVSSRAAARKGPPQRPLTATRPAGVVHVPPKPLPKRPRSRRRTKRLAKAKPDTSLRTVRWLAALTGAIVAAWAVLP